MNTAMQWPILLIIILAFVKSKEPGSTSSADLRVVPCTLIVGRPSCIQLRLSGDPKGDKKNLFVWKIADGSTIDDVPSKEDFIFDHTNKKEDLDIYVPVGYSYIWNSDKQILTIFIEEVGWQHEGAWVAEYLDKPFPFHLEVLAAPPSTQAPDTSTDGVKDCGAVDAHREDCKDWKNMASRQTTVIIILVLVILGLVILVLVIVFRARSTKQGQEETTDDKNAPGTPSGDISVQMRGFRELRAGHRSSDEGGNPPSTDAVVQIATDDASSDNRTRVQAASPSTPLLGETGGQGATPSTMQSFNSRGDSRQRLRNHNPYSTVQEE